MPPSMIYRIKYEIRKDEIEGPGVEGKILVP
jgi:hypothetical protein